MDVFGELDWRGASVVRIRWDEIGRGGVKCQSGMRWDAMEQDEMRWDEVKWLTGFITSVTSLSAKGHQGVLV